MSAGASGGRERPNLAAVAALAGVSPSTASLAFSGAGPVAEATRARVLAAAEQLNYGGPDPRAQSLRRGRSGIIGVVMEERVRDAFRDPMNIAMLDGLADELGSIGAGLLLLTETGNERLDVASAPVDAVVLVGCGTGFDETLGILQQRGMPIVAVEAPRMPGVLAIDLDNRVSSATISRHLKELGHERIASVTLPLRKSHEPGRVDADWHDWAASEVGIQRLAGVEDVFGPMPTFSASNSSIDAGLVAGLDLLSDPAGRPTAVIAQSDLLAIGVIRAVEQLGLFVPYDVSVVGFDGARIDSGYDLTTMVQPAVDKGRAAARAIIELLGGEGPKPVSFTTVFHLGNTTAEPPTR